MNFLAHIFLSFNHPKIEIGNFMADSVKGKNFTNYTTEIQKGIILHRKIDDFTDHHKIIKQLKIIFKDYGLYRSVILDIVLDHFLAKNWQKFHKTPLLQFSNNFYELLDSNFDILPKRVQLFYPMMLSENWLFKYRTIEGISNILFQMNVRTHNISKMNYAAIEMVENYETLEKQFFIFFSELIEFSKKELEKIK